MKRRLHLLLGLLGLTSMLLQACGGAEPVADLKPVPPASMFVEQPVRFCGNADGDKVSVGYYGADPLDTLIYLYIVCHERDTVYRASYPGAWFAEGAAAADLGAKVEAVHGKMHALAEGKLLPALDSVDVAAAQGQPLFGVDLPGHVQSVIYYSAADKKVHSLE